MTEAEVIVQINEVFEESFEIEKDKLRPQAHIFNDLGLDSLDTVDLVVALQKKFKIQVRDDARVRTVQTLDDLYKLVLAIKTEQEAALKTPPPAP